MKGVKLSASVVRRKLRGGVRTYTAYRITIPHELVKRLGWDAQTVLLMHVKDEDGKKVLVVKPAPT